MRGSRAGLSPPFYTDDESQEVENLAEVEDEEPSSRSRFEAGHSRSGRRVTRYVL